jgi:regulator of protease activity HflC (stomatin/prohibitin superfamily)
LADFIDWVKKHRVAMAFLIVFLFIFLLIILVAAIISVPAGYKAVVTSAPDAGYIGTTLGEGWHVNPYFLLCNIELIRYNSQSVEFIGYDYADDNYGSIAVRSNDNLEVYVDFSVTYHIPADRVSDIRLQYGDYRHTILEQVCRSVPRDVAAQYNALDIIGENRNAVERSIRQNITAQLAEHDIVVELFSLRDIRPPASVSKAIEDKKVAEQYLITAGYQAQARIVLAQGNLTATIINANATAQAQVIKANGSAEAIQLIMEMFKLQDPSANNVTLNYLTWLYIQALSDPNSNIQYIIVPQGNGVPILVQVQP